MIGKALQFAACVLDQYIKNKFGLDENKVLLNNLIEANGSLPQRNQNKVVISLINIEKENTRQFYNSNQLSGSRTSADINPAQRFNLDVLISSNFDDYTETLKFLNTSILFFQANPFFDVKSFSAIPEGLQRLEFDIEKISYREMQSLWTAMGAKYQPSVIYKVRLVTIQANEIKGFAPVISQTSNLATV